MLAFCEISFGPDIIIIIIIIIITDPPGFIALKPGRYGG